MPNEEPLGKEWSWSLLEAFLTHCDWVSSWGRTGSVSEEKEPHFFSGNERCTPHGVNTERWLAFRHLPLITPSEYLNPRRPWPLGSSHWNGAELGRQDSQGLKYYAPILYAVELTEPRGP